MVFKINKINNSNRNLYVLDHLIMSSAIQMFFDLGIGIHVNFRLAASKDSKVSKI